MTRSPARSRGHVVFLWDRTVEVYVDLARGDLYRAPVTNVLDVRTGYRIGRWEAPSHMAEEALSYLLAAQDGNFSSGTWYRSKAAELMAAAKKEVPA